jgi:hypothetical protein
MPAILTTDEQLGRLDACSGTRRRRWQRPSKPPKALGLTVPPTMLATADEDSGHRSRAQHDKVKPPNPLARSPEHERLTLPEKVSVELKR